MTADPTSSTTRTGLTDIPYSSRSGVRQILEMRRDPFGTHDRRIREFGEISAMKAFGQRWVVAAGPAAAEEVLMNKQKAFANGPAWTFLIGPFFDRGVMLLDFDEHRSHRLILQQAFTPTVLRRYMDMMQPVIADRVAALPAGDVHLFHRFKALTLDLALEVFLGVHLPKAEADRINRAFLDTVQAGVSLIRFPLPGGRWWKGVRSRKVLEDFLRAHIPAKRATETDDLFSVLCHARSDEGAMFDDDDVINHLIFVLMAAHDTSTIALTQMTYRMAVAPEWQRRVREESLALGPDLTHDDLTAMPVTDAVFRETLRMCTPVPAHPRMTVKDTEIQGHFVPAGSYVMLPAMQNHYDAGIYTDPWTFDPDRYSPGRAEDKKHRMAWSPFGGGVHKCIGLYFGQMEIKTILHHLVRGHEWSIADGYEMPMNYSALPIPKDGFPATLRPLRY